MPRLCSRSSIPSLQLALVAVASATVMAGPIDPPAGPVAPTYKTLTQVEPRTPISSATTPGNSGATFRITKPGSYYLIDNVSGEVNKDGIDIASSNVTIDLNGFSMIGVANSDNGITAAPSSTQITIRNGVIRNWGGSGISLSNNFDVTIENIRAQSNASSGISAGSVFIIRDCVTSLNSGEGIFCFNDCLIFDCITRDNGSDGVFMSNGSSCRHVTSSDNLGAGINTSDGCIVTDCQITSNSGTGIDAGWRCTLTDNFIFNNGLHGITTGTQTRITGNNIENNGSVGTGYGISMASGTSSATIEDNSISYNDIGIKIDGTSCLVIRNFIRGNTTNLSIAAGNVVGPLTTSATVSLLTNPSANYSN